MHYDDGADYAGGSGRHLPIAHVHATMEEQGKFIYKKLDVSVIFRRRTDDIRLCCP